MSNKSNPVRRDTLTLARYTAELISGVCRTVGKNSAARMMLNAGATVEETSALTGLEVADVSSLLSRMLRGL